MLTTEDCEPEDQTLKTDLHERLEAALRQLPERERMILSRRFGLGHDGAETLEEVGACLAVSRERVRQLESRALKRLKDFCTSAGLQEYLH
jgi:RNA polymerase sigma factor (sigma-70 family)